MLRSLVTLAALTLIASPALAQLPGGLQIVDAKATKDKLTWNECKMVPVQQTVEVDVVINGIARKEKRTITVYEKITVTKTMDMKGLKATDMTGKAIDADKVVERLKEETPVVMFTGSLSEKHRKLFRDTTVFIELPHESPGGGAGTAPVFPVPVPPVVIPAPGGAPPVVLPPGEKKG